MRRVVQTFISLCLFGAAASFSPSGASDEVTPSRRNLIIQGETAPEDRYPYFTTLDHYCGGALIAPDVILTAGHCKPSRRDLDKVHLAIGRYSFANKKHGVSESFLQDDIAIEQAVRHADWKRLGDDEFRHDFTLLFLQKPVTNTPIVKINRNPFLPRENEEVRAMGVGFTHADYESKANILQQVQLNYLSNDRCEQSTDGTDSYQGRIDETHMCTTGGPDNERDACAYDSGSPIIIPGDSPQDDVLVALVSWGMGCADPNFPGVNARVSAVSEWIDETVCTMSQNPPVEFCPAQPTAKRVLPWTDLIAFGVGLFALVVVGLAVFSQKRKNRWTEQRQRGVYSVLGSAEKILGTPRTDPDVESYGSMDALSISDDDLSLT